MTLRSTTLLVLFITLSVRHGFASDTVKLDNEAPGEKSGVIAWGDKTEAKTLVVSPVDIGAIGPAIPRQVVAFTMGRPPALDADITWTNGDDTVTIAYPPEYEIPIQYWILCGAADCSAPVSKKQKARLAGYLVWANERLRKERVGIRLVRAGGNTDWISDQTPLKGSNADDLLNISSSDCSDMITESTSGIKTAAGFNVYMVQSVNHSVREGAVCGTDDSSVVGYRALYGTMLHELGHNLSLWHELPDYPWFDTVGGKKNLMSDVSTTRRYFSEGQVFRIHFSEYSGLNHSLSSNLPKPSPPNRTPRDCVGEKPAELPCPDIDTLLWSGF